MTALVLDAGALLAVDRGERALAARLRTAQRKGMELRTNAVVVGQVWRDSRGRQVELAKLLRGVDVRSVEPRAGREAGVLLGRAGTRDVVDATVVLLAENGDRIATSDPADIEQLATAAGRLVVIVPC